ncbi:unnamed protein product [Caenorhabditis brenneri]
MTISVTIANRAQWSANPDIEMKLVLKRAYFKPGFIYTINGLNPVDEYDIHLETRQIGNYRYKLENGCARLHKFCHQEFVSGSDVGQLIDFSNVFFVKKGKKNSDEDKECTIELETVFKYEPSRRPVARRQRNRPIARVRSPVPVVSTSPPVCYAPVPYYHAPMPYYVPYHNQPYLPPLAN